MVFEEVERARARFEARLAPAVADVFGEQAEAVLGALARGGIPAAEAVAADTAYAAEALYLVWAAVAPPFATAAYEAVAPDTKASKAAPPPDAWLDAVLDFLAREGGVMVRAITDTVLADLRRVLAAGMEGGLGMDAMARELREVWPDLTASRALRIIRTEVVASSNAGSILGYEAAARDYGIEMEIEWVSTSDGRVREEHADANGQRVPLGGLFDVGGEEARYPGDPNLSASNRVHCRCTTVPVIFEPKALTSRPAAPPPVTWREERDARLRADYDARKASYPYWSDLVTEMADAEGLAFDTVRKIVHTKG